MIPLNSCSFRVNGSFAGSVCDVTCLSSAAPDRQMCFAQRQSQTEMCQGQRRFCSSQKAEVKPFSSSEAMPCAGCSEPLRSAWPWESRRSSCQGRAEANHCRLSLLILSRSRFAPLHSVVLLFSLCYLELLFLCPSLSLSLLIAVSVSLPLSCKFVGVSASALRTTCRPGPCSFRHPAIDVA